MRGVFAAACFVFGCSACAGGGGAAVGVSHGIPKGTARTSKASAPSAKTPWPFARGYRASLAKVTTGAASRGHDPGRYVYDLYRGKEGESEILVMDHFPIEGSSSIAFAYAMKREAGGAWSYFAVTPAPGEPASELSASAASTLVPEDGPCAQCHSEAPKDSLFSVR